MIDRFMRFPDGKPKAFTMSYDDGCPEDIRFSETFTKYGLKCTFNLNNDSFKKFNYNKEQIEDLFLSKGHEVALHGAKHKANGNMSTVIGIRDVLEKKIKFSDRFSGKYKSESLLGKTANKWCTSQKSNKIPKKVSKNTISKFHYVTGQWSLSRFGQTFISSNLFKKGQ